MADEDSDFFRRLVRGDRAGYFFTRFWFLRGLGLIYLVAFGSLAMQLPGLLGSRGILPVGSFESLALARLGSFSAVFWKLPSLFWFAHSDAVLNVAAWLGTALGFLILMGYANAPILLAAWVLYLSFAHVGQVFYGYGWELLLCETGFLAIFIAPPWRLTPLALSAPPPPITILLLRWLTFRVMFGAGLIKIRGDECWTQLSCLVYHYETQPNPSPLSWLFAKSPLIVSQAGVLFNHLVELIAPFGVFGPRRVRHAAGLLIVVFQLGLILSGNLSFLNWLTIVVAIGCFDDSWLGRLAPAGARERALSADARPSKLHGRVAIGYAVLVAGLSLSPVVNMLSPRQRMNGSFEPFDLVNTYGAFGSVTRERHEVVLEGTDAALPDDAAEWREYQFPCKPGDPMRRPCLVTPYHYRLDWQLWFAGLTQAREAPWREQPWIINLTYKLLLGEPAVLALLDDNPFPDHPPRYIRARLYRYRFTGWGEAGWWRREYLRDYFGPISKDDPELREVLEFFRWPLE